MNEEIRWYGIVNALQYFSDAIRMLTESLSSENTAGNNTTETGNDINVLDHIPENIFESLTTEYYEPGMISLGQEYFEKLLKQGYREKIRRIITSLYQLAGRKRSHILEINTIMIISQLPYLGEWEDILAVAATRSPNLDVQEAGIRCFERWENKEACEFLRGRVFSEDWLQEYADEVCAEVLEGCDEVVLPEKDSITWEMATTGSNQSGDIERYSSGYRDGGAEDNGQQAFPLAGGK